jgi:hypothetical protein
MASKTCSAATTCKVTQGASATTPWPIAAIVSSSTSAELTAGVEVAILKSFRKDHGSVCCSKDLEFLIIFMFL